MERPRNEIIDSDVFEAFDLDSMAKYFATRKRSTFGGSAQRVARC